MFPPIVLLADSRPLFGSGPAGGPFLSDVAAFSPSGVRRVAYLGASNGDRPEFYELFAAAAAPLDATEIRHVKDAASDDDLSFLDEADLLLLAGGDVQRGLQSFERSGVGRKVVDAYLRGAILVGVSAGAIALGPAGHTGTAPGFGFLPFVVDVHDEERAWSGLRAALAGAAAGARGIGVPRGGTAVFHRDGVLEPFGCALTELVVGEDRAVVESLLLATAGRDRAS